MAQADVLQGEAVLDPAATADLDQAIDVLAGELGRRWRYSHLDLVVAGCVQAPPDYSTKIHEPERRTHMTVPSGAVRGIRVRPRLVGGPELRGAIARAREVLAQPKYARKHSEGRSCGEITCMCSLAAVDPETVRADVSPIIDMQISSSEDPITRAYDRQGQIVETRSQGRWYGFGLRTIVGLRFFNE